MNKFMLNLKKYYPFLLNSIIPLIIFFLPVYVTVYTDEIETLRYVYNFYELIDFSIDPVFAAFCLLIFISSAINLLFFIICMIHNYKIVLYKPLINKILLLFSYIISIASLGCLIYAIHLSTLSNSEIFIFENSFHVGTIIFLIYSVVQSVIITINYKRKKF